MRQLNARAVNKLNRSLTNRDFFGIEWITSKDIAAAYKDEPRPVGEAFRQRYEPLLVKRDQLANEESEEDLTFGRIRRDDRNTPQYHGQFDLENTKPMYGTIQIKQRFVPADETPQKTNNETSQTLENELPPNARPAYRISDVQAVKNLNEILDLLKSEEKDYDIMIKYSEAPPLKYFFDSSIGDSSQTVNYDSSSKSQRSRKEKSTGNKHVMHDERTQEPSDPHTMIEAKANRLTERDVNRIIRTLDEDPSNEEIPLHDLNPMTEEFEKKFHDSLRDSRFDKALDEKYNETRKEPMNKVRKPFEHLNKLRNGEITPTSSVMKNTLSENGRLDPLKPQIRLDSKGKRIYSDVVPDWYKVRRAEALEYFQKSIIYHNYEILAINKPYGIASHAEASEVKSPFDANEVMNELARTLFRYEKLFLAHRLDKSTTGILLFATSEERARILHKQFKAGEVKKTYLALAKGIPNPEEGIIDIPIGELRSAGKVRMCPAPEGLAPEKQLAQRYREARGAITRYKTLNCGKGNISLVELKPESGVKHQIRCHLGFCLKTPILGDHKYTDIGRLAPQKLHPQALKALQIRQEKVRTLPMHLHANAVMIPDGKANRGPLFIKAPLPHHFKESMKALGLSYYD